MPVVSVVVPAFNVERFIEPAVRSALAQTVTDIEVIVVNDGSTDETRRVLAGISDPRLRIIDQENKGLPGARNTGIAASSADLIAFLDGDDTWEPRKLECHQRAMLDEPKAQISFDEYRYIDESGNPKGVPTDQRKPRYYCVDIIKRNRIGNGSTPVVRTSAFVSAGLFNTSLRSCEDWEMWTRILRIPESYAVRIPEVLTNYRINTQSLSMNVGRFVENARLAADAISATAPDIPASVVRQGLADTFRIAATKALRAGDRRSSRRVLLDAVRLSPGTMVIDRKFWATLGLSVLPVKL